MIALTKLNKEQIVINADLIETIESIPETLITLTTSRKITVRDALEDVVKKVIRYKQLTHQTIGVVTKEEKQTPQK
jgi:flagellar protein FlbD